MPTLLYGLTTSADPVPPGLTGIAGGAPRLLRADALRAIVGTVREKPAPTLDTVQAHDAVLQAFVGAGATVAAVRFGQVFDDDAACLAEVRARGARIAAVLKEHDGCVEMRVLLPVGAEDAPQPPRAPAPGMGPGRAYLESLRAQGQVAPNLALAPMIGPSVRAERVEGFASRRGPRGVAFAHLVRRDDVPAYRDAIRAIPALAEARVVGPLPLYSFAEAAR